MKVIKKESFNYDIKKDLKKYNKSLRSVAIKSDYNYNSLFRAMQGERSISYEAYLKIKKNISK